MAVSLRKYSWADQIFEDVRIRRHSRHVRESAAEAARSVHRMAREPGTLRLTQAEVVLLEPAHLQAFLDAHNLTLVIE